MHSVNTNVTINNVNKNVSAEILFQNFLINFSLIFQIREIVLKYEKIP